MRTQVLFSLFVVAGLIAGCSTEPKSEAKKESLRSNVQAAVAEMKTVDPGVEDFMNKGYGYVVFPSIGKGGLIVGGAYGRGEVYEQGNMIGFADVTQANIGLQAGGQTYKEIVVFENADALTRFKSGKLKFSADASAVALKSGAAATAEFQDGVAVITHPNGGLMFEASIGGQSFSFIPKDEATD